MSTTRSGPTGPRRFSTENERDGGCGRFWLALVLACGLAACTSTVSRPPVAGLPPPPPGSSPPPPAVPGAPEPPSKAEEDALGVQAVGETLTVTAWAEPARLPPFGGQCQILVRVRKRGGAPMPGVEVRLKTSKGTLFAEGKTLVTDQTGQTRDRLTSREAAVITLNAGGTRYRFEIPLAESP